jgi:hypothetical protein
MSFQIRLKERLHSKNKLAHFIKLELTKVYDSLCCALPLVSGEHICYEQGFSSSVNAGQSEGCNLLFQIKIITQFLRTI